ncbi:MAG: hypothetical protein EDX89_06365 [Acidobacteria bacterium]|nr:MAG: hypothetical protein EDX89_06365 [Acidobacteriota bacterium]MCE7956999.1 hypothetical protein [Acidobacteria bacterium ACB2]
MAALGANAGAAQINTEPAKTPSGKTVMVAPPDMTNVKQIPFSKVKILKHIPLKDLKGKPATLPGVKGGVAPFVVDPSALYSNVTNFAFSGLSAGAAGVYGSGARTVGMMDDTFMTGNTEINGAKLCTYNGNAAPTEVQYVQFLYLDNGGAPGERAPGGGCVPGGTPACMGGWGVSFSAGNEHPDGVVCWYVDLSTMWTTSPGSASIWTWSHFADNNGALLVSEAELANYGLGIFTGPDVGTSTDNYWVRTGVGGADTPAPAGTIYALGAGESFGIELTANAPVPVTLQSFDVE